MGMGGQQVPTVMQVLPIVAQPIVAAQQPFVTSQPIVTQPMITTQPQQLQRSFIKQPIIPMPQVQQVQQVQVPLPF